MNSFLLNSNLLVFVVNVAIGTCLVCAIALVATRLIRRRTAALRHSLLVVAIGLTMFCPAVVFTSSSLGVGLFSIADEDSTADLSLASATYDVVTDTGQSETALSREPEGRIDNLSYQKPQEDRSAAIAAATGAPGAVVPLFSGTNAWRLGLTAFVAIWAAGLLVCCARFVRGVFRVRKLRRTLVEVTNPRVQDAAHFAFESIGIREHGVFESSFAPAPLTIGLLRPVIVIPIACSDLLDDNELNCVLLHEAAHVKRRDTWIGLLQSITRALFWWNPLLTIANRCVNRLREQICDDYVLAAHGDGRPLAKAIIKVAEWSIATAAPLPCTATLTSESEELSERINRLTDKKPVMALRLDWKAFSSLLLFSLLLAVVLFVPTLRSATAQTSEDEERAKAGAPDKNSEAPDAAKSATADRQATGPAKEAISVPNVKIPVRAVESMIVSHFDINRDGTLTPDELRKTPWPNSEATLMQCDFNRDKKVSLSELSDMLDLVYRRTAKQRQEMPDRFAVYNWRKYDANRDGSIDRTESKKTPYKSVGMWFRGDLNGDDRITLNELNLAYTYRALEKSIQMKTAVEKKYAIGTSRAQESESTSKIAPAKVPNPAIRN